MQLIFGISFDRSAAMTDQVAVGGVSVVGPSRFIALLEEYLGLGRDYPNVDYLRVEQFRQLLQADLEKHPEAFYGASFLADPFATAAEILSRRDECVLAGWDFRAVAGLPERLGVLARLKEQEGAFAYGFADRFEQVYVALKQGRHPIRGIQVVEPLNLTAAPWRRMFERLQETGVRISFGLNPTALAPEDTDLGKFQRRVVNGGGVEKASFRGDGSLVLIYGKRDTDLAAFIAAWLRQHPALKPGLLHTGPSRALDNALVREGLPSLGLQSVSLARPALQVLKLIPVFLWEPLDPYKVLEFVSLAIKPLDEELSARIAQQMAQIPGVFSDSWQQMLGQYFAELEAEGRDVPSIRMPYRFWFERKRYDSNGTAPKSDALAMFSYLSDWAFGQLRNGDGGASMGVLRTQASRIVELLQALPEDRLSRLQLERIVRTIYEPAPIQLRQQEAGSMPAVQQPGAIDQPVDTLLWWNFSQAEPDYFFSRWSKKERHWLESQGVLLVSPEDQNQLLLWQRKLPLLQTRKQLVLIQPAVVEGKAVQPHPLMGDLEAGFNHLEAIVYAIDHRGGVLDTILAPIPVYHTLPLRKLGQPALFLEMPAHAKLEVREAESFSSLETLLYYPYQWVFRYKLQLRKSAILGIVDERTLSGNLAHRFFELLLQQPVLMEWSHQEIEGFIEAQAEDLLRKEGAVLLLYGREPERVRLIRKVKRAAVILVDLLQQNGWKVYGTEKNLEGFFGDRRLRGRVDLILERPGELAVVDLKWGGEKYREDLIRNEEDLQLALYTHLLGDLQLPVHSAYFILEKGKMIARNQAAFQDVKAVTPKADHQEVSLRILERTRATLEWRVRQLAVGKIEVRCERNFQALEMHYEAEDLLSLLEMKKMDAPFDEYKTLVHLF